MNSEIGTFEHLWEGLDIPLIPDNIERGVIPLSTCSFDPWNWPLHEICYVLL